MENHGDLLIWNEVSMKNNGCVFCGSLNISKKVDFCWDCCKNGAFVTEATEEDSVEKNIDQKPETKPEDSSQKEVK